MDKVKDIQVAVLGVCLLVGMLVGSFVIAGTLVKVKRNDVLSVTGAASQLITSDHASWSCSVARQSGSLASAYEALKVDLNAVKAYLVKNGFAEKDIKVSGVSRSELYARDNRGYSTNDIEAYVMRQTITRSMPLRGNLPSYWLTALALPATSRSIFIQNWMTSK